MTVSRSDAYWGRAGTRRNTRREIRPTRAGSGAPRGMPMSITRTSPTRHAPGATYRPIFGAWFVVVTSARIAGPSTSPVAAFTPDGTSAAITGAPAALIAAMT